MHWTGYRAHGGPPCGRIPVWLWTARVDAPSPGSILFMNQFDPGFAREQYERFQEMPASRILSWVAAAKRTTEKRRPADRPTSTRGPIILGYGTAATGLCPPERRRPWVTRGCRPSIQRLIGALQPGGRPDKETVHYDRYSPLSGCADALWSDATRWDSRYLGNTGAKVHGSRSHFWRGGSRRPGWGRMKWGTASRWAVLNSGGRTT